MTLQEMMGSFFEGGGNPTQSHYLRQAGNTAEVDLGDSNQHRFDRAASEPRKTPRGRECENSRQGRDRIADDLGYVCSRQDLSLSTQCCDRHHHDESGIEALDFAPHTAWGLTHDDPANGHASNINTPAPRYSCAGCSPYRHCCQDFETCVSCCLHPNNPIAASWEEDLMPLLSRAATPSQSGLRTTSARFPECMQNCRTNSRALIHQNKYKSDEHFCYLGSWHFPKVPTDVHPIASGQEALPCTEVCASFDLVCDNQYFAFINNCEVLQRQFSCEDCEESDTAHPLFYPPDTMLDAASTPLLKLKGKGVTGTAASSINGRCEFSSVDGNFSCAFAHPSARTLCACREDSRMEQQQPPV
jgi:hypothetical protein